MTKQQKAWNLDGFIYISYAAPHYSAGISAIYFLRFLAKFGWVPFADLRVRSLAMKYNKDFTEGGWKIFCLVLSLIVYTYACVCLCVCVSLNF